MYRKISRAVLLLLSIILIVGIFPQQSLATGGISVIALANKGTASQKGTAEGQWGHTMAGYRITVVNGAAQPIFKFYGSTSLDLLLGNHNLANMDYFMDGHKFGGEYSIYDNIGDIDSYVMQSNELYHKLALGKSNNPQGWQSEIAKKDKQNYAKDYTTAIDQLHNMISPFERDKKDTWIDNGPSVRKVFYGNWDQIKNTALIYVLFNLRTVGANGEPGHYLWQPVEGSTFSKQDCQDVRDNKISPADLMGKRGVIIEVEPIIWNRLREHLNSKTESDFTFGVYGTQSSLGYLIDKLLTTKDKRTGEYLFEPDRNGAFGGVDFSLFGGFGRKCMVTNESTLTLLNKRVPDGSQLRIVKPTNGDAKMANGKLGVSNKEVSTLKTPTQGWSMHVYVTKLERPDLTTTFDQIVPPGVTPGKAPDPHVDPANKELVNIEQLDHYNIVKVYQTRDSVTNVVTHDATFTREETIPKILIEHETDYLVKEWKYGLPDPDNPVIDGPTGVGTKWGDDPIKTIVPIESGTKPIPAEVDIANKDDKDEVRTLYVLLEKPTKKPLPPPPPPPPAPSTPASNIITESQLVKAISTDRALVGNNWGSYNFSATLEAAVTSHKYTIHAGKECEGDHEGTCNHMRRANNDNYVSATTADQFNGRQVEPVETKGH